MLEQPSVSVIIATYNRAGLLRETIESIFNQRFRNFELIVVDDGSTDETQEVLKTYGGRLRCLRQENGGPSAARNLGARHARAPWISIQDSDDLCASNHLEVLFGYATEHPDIGMVFANGGYISGQDHNRKTIIPRGKSAHLALSGIQLLDLFDKSIVRLQAALISKRCYDRVGGHDENLRIAMDLDLAFRIYGHYPVAYLDEVVFYYRKHEGNIGRNLELRLLENIRVIEKLLAEYPDAQELLGRRRISHRIAYRYYHLAKGRRKSGDQEGARSALRQALMHQPLSMKYRAYQVLWA
jgi:glycosyltransferase involved in cell wall biosynthesis